MGLGSIIEQLEAATTVDGHAEFRVGDTVRVHVRIVEGLRERVQAFEGVVIKRRRGGNRGTFTVRKVSYGVGVERVFPINSPRVDRIDGSHRTPEHARQLVVPLGSGGQGRIASPPKRALPGPDGS